MAYSLIQRRDEFPEAAKKLRSLLGQAWDYGRGARLISADLPNHWRDIMHGRLRSKGKIVKGQHQGKVHRTLCDEELSVLLQWALENMHPNGRDGLILYLWTGMRGSEIYGLRPEFISQEKDEWWITYPVALLKTEAQADTVDHRVPLYGRALEIVKERIKWVGKTGKLFESVRVGRLFQYSKSAFGTYIYNLMPYSTKVTNRKSTTGLACPCLNGRPMIFGALPAPRSQNWSARYKLPRP